MHSGRGAVILSSILNEHTTELMHLHCGTNNRAPRWTFTDPCKPEVRSGTREESSSPAWLAALAMNARDTTKVCIWRLDNGCELTLYRKCHSHNTPGNRHNKSWVEPLTGNWTTSSTQQRKQVWQKCRIHKNWCTNTVAQTIEHHGGHSKSNWNPSSRRHLSVFIRSRFHTIFALNGKEFSISVQSHLQVHRWCIVHKQHRIRKLSGPDVSCWTWDQRHHREHNFCFLPRFTTVDWEGWFQFPHHKLSVPE